MSAARTLTVTVSSEIADALDQSVQSGEFATDREALVAAAKSWQRRRDLIERQTAAIRRDITASIDDPEPSIAIEEVERRMELFMARAREIALDEKV